MAYPGPWTQLEDFEARGRTIAYDGEFQGAAASIPSEERSGSDLADMTGLLSRIESAPYSPTASSDYSPRLSATLSPQVSTPLYGRAGKSLGARRIGPLSTNPPSSIIPAAPAGAVGYEWQSPTGTVTAGRLSATSLQATGAANNYELGRVGIWEITLGIAADTGTVPLSYMASPLLLDGRVARWAIDDSPQISGVADISSYLNDAGRFQLMGDGHASVTEFVDDFAAETTWSASLPYSVREVDDGVPGIRVYYTVRPPLFRWLYTTPQTPPPQQRPAPLRIVQRGNDGLGVTGGRRIFGAKTIQSSNRRGSAIR